MRSSHPQPRDQSRFAVPSPCASGRYGAGRSSVFRRRCDPVAGWAARSSISAVVASPTRVDPASRVPRPALRVATAQGGAVSSEGRCDPVAGWAARSSISAVVASPTRVDPASRVPRPALRVATAQGGAVSSTGRCRPYSGMQRPQIRVAAFPPLPESLLRRASRATLRGRPPSSLRSLTRQTACKARPIRVAVKSGAHGVAAPWHRSPSYDQRRAPYDHPDFNSNALNEDLFSGSLNKLDRLVVFQDFLKISSQSCDCFAKKCSDIFCRKLLIGDRTKQKNYRTNYPSVYPFYNPLKGAE